MQALRADLLFYLHNLYPADYMLVMLIAFLFIVFLIFMLILRDSGFMVGLLLFFTVVGLPTLAVSGEMLIDKVARTRYILVDSAKIYKFSNSLHIAFTLQNQSKNTFNFCKIVARLYKQNDANTTTLMKYKNDLHVLRRKSIVLKQAIKPKALVNSTIIFKDFNIKVPYDVKMSSTCF